MRKNTFLSVALLAASVSVVNAQEAPKELFWQNGSNTGIWSIMDSEWGEDKGRYRYVNIKCSQSTERWYNCKGWSSKF